MPKRREYITVDVFTDRPFAVIIDASGLTPAEMQGIAAAFNDSESTVVLPPEEEAHTARVRIFTPRDEIPFAGHPNIGTAFAIALVGERSDQVASPFVLSAPILLPRRPEATATAPVLLRRAGRPTPTAWSRRAGDAACCPNTSSSSFCACARCI